MNEQPASSQVLNHDFRYGDMAVGSWNNASYGTRTKVPAAPILRKHKNELVMACKRTQIDLAEIDLVDMTDRNGLIVRLYNCPLDFQLEQAPNDYNAFRCRYRRFQPDYPYCPWVEELAKAHDGSRSPAPYGLKIEDVCAGLVFWLETVVAEYRAEKEREDLWSQLRQLNYGFLAPATAIEPEFLLGVPDEEKEEIKRRLDGLVETMQHDIALTGDQLAMINTRIDYLLDAVNRLNRFDWMGLAFSVLTGISINLTVDTELGRRTFGSIRQLLGAVSQLLRV